MKKSFVDRIFPHSSQPLLPQQEQRQPHVRPSLRSSTPPARNLTHITHALNTYSASDHSSQAHVASSASGKSSNHDTELSNIPLSASVLHHDDPFLPVERAARALQDTIQSLLDAQSRALSGRTNGVEQEDVTSGGSVTPTPSTTTPRSSIRTVPIRQPAKKVIGLRAARKGLARKIHQFAELKEEELQILDTQISIRARAIERVEELQAKKSACATEIESIQQEGSSTTVTNLRTEAKNVQSEIEELEHRLLELRVRHRHLLNQADQIESAQASKISSFQGTIAMVEKETRRFLRQLPVSHALSDDKTLHSSGMYALRPERRTLDMAKAHWMSEQEILEQRKVDVGSERTALLEGAQVWVGAVREIDNFEQNLRVRTTSLADRASVFEDNNHASIDTVIQDMDVVIQRLESDLTLAETKGWNLLICAIGAELETFQQGRELLEQTQHVADSQNEYPTTGNDSIMHSSFAGGGNMHRISGSPNGSTGSNQSLKDTLNNFDYNPDKLNDHTKPTAAKYESEDDEPPADFLLSH